LIAEAVYPGGAKALKVESRLAPLKEKERWAMNIDPKMDIRHNRSKSFQVFRDGIFRLVRSSSNEDLS